MDSDRFPCLPLLINQDSEISRIFSKKSRKSDPVSSRLSQCLHYFIMKCLNIPSVHSIKDWIAPAVKKIPRWWDAATPRRSESTATISFSLARCLADINERGWDRFVASEAEHISIGCWSRTDFWGSFQEKKDFFACSKERVDTSSTTVQMRRARFGEDAWKPYRYKFLLKLNLQKTKPNKDL